MTRWYVAHTHANSELKAAFHLRNQDFAVYLPRRLKRRSHARRIDQVPAPLFPRYLFVALDLAVTRWRAIRSTVGVSDLVCNGDMPAAVPIGVVEEIKAREDANGMVPLVSSRRFTPGERVEVFEGALSGLAGLFESEADEQRVVVLLDLLGRQVRVSVPRETIQAA